MALANIVLRGFAAGLACTVVSVLLTPAASFCASPRSSLVTDEHIAHQDRLKYQNDYRYLYYFTVRTLPEPQRERAARILSFVVPSLCTGTQLDVQLPTQIDDGLYRIHTQHLGWDKALPSILRERYPYASYKGALPLVTRADWFIQFAMDQTKSNDTYFRLLFGKPVKTVDQFFALVGAEPSTDFSFGHIEADSRVAVNKVRLITTVPTLRRTDLWHTFDFERIDRKTDPLENLTRGIRDGKHDHQASEIIIGLPKSLPGGSTGSLQGYALADGQGQIQEVAPTNIVVDDTGTRGVEIINPLSCVACHVEGLRQPSTNALKSYLNSGAEAYINDYDAQQEVDRFHLTEIQKWLARSNEDYTAAVEACNGYTPAENAAAFSQLIREYDRPLTLEDAARELYVAPEVLSNALGYWSAARKQMPARLAALAHGGTINRDSWESSYRFAVEVVAVWRASQN
jgi:hypothetical protein